MIEQIRDADPSTSSGLKAQSRQPVMSEVERSKHTPPLSSNLLEQDLG